VALPSVPYRIGRVDPGRWSSASNVGLPLTLRHRLERWTDRPGDRPGLQFPQQRESPELLGPTRRAARACLNKTRSWCSVAAGQRTIFYPGAPVQTMVRTDTVLVVGGGRR
jgi:hypothetical protein